MVSQTDLTLIHNTLSKAHSILIPIPELHGAKNIGAALALASLLKSQGKRVDVLCINHHLAYLDSLVDISSLTSILQDNVESIITINTQNCPINSLKYDKTDSELTIYLNSPLNSFSSELVSIQPGKQVYDLIITLDTMNWIQIGEYFKSSPHIFLHTSTLALSSFNHNHPYTNMTVSVSEYSSSAYIIGDYIKSFYSDIWTRDILNGLLLSMLLSSSHSIEEDKMIIELRELGAHYDQIQSAINQDISDNHRLLIGRILAHMEWISIDKEGDKKRYAYSKLFPHDFIKTNTRIEDIPFIISIIKTYLPLDIEGIHILVDKGQHMKQGYIDMTTSMSLIVLAELEGEMKEDIVSYTYPSDKDIHLAGKEINSRIQLVMKNSL